MAYTNPWDETFPLGTSAANLLATDINTVELNVRERMASFGAGVFANLPTPEAVFDVTTNGYGVTYYATDSNQGIMYQWNNGAWLPIWQHCTLQNLTPGSGTIVSDTTVNGTYLEPIIQIIGPPQRFRILTNITIELVGSAIQSPVSTVQIFADGSSSSVPLFTYLVGGMSLGVPVKIVIILDCFIRETASPGVAAATEVFATYYDLILNQNIMTETTANVYYTAPFLIYPSVTTAGGNMFSLDYTFGPMFGIFEF